MKVNIKFYNFSDQSTKAPKHQDTGFTLLEVIIAVFILALMSMMIWQITNSAYRGSEKAGKYDNVYQNCRLALKKMTDDISMAFMIGPVMQGKKSDGTPATETAFEGNGDSINFDTFSNIRYIKNEKKGDQVEVGYSMAECPDSEERLQCLMKRESFQIDKNIKEGGKSVPIAKGVKRLAIKYYDPVKQEWRDDWKTSDPVFNGKLPYAVKIEIAFTDPKDEKEEIMFETAVTLPLSAAAIDF